MQARSSLFRLDHTFMLTLARSYLFRLFQARSCIHVRLIMLIQAVVEAVICSGLLIIFYVYVFY